MRGGRSRERGSAVADFVLVLVVLVPLFLGILQVGLVLLVRNTLASAASEGARYAATRDRGPEDGRARTRSQITGAVSGRFARDIEVCPEDDQPGRGREGAYESFTVVALVSPMIETAQFHSERTRQSPDGM